MYAIFKISDIFDKKTIKGVPKKNEDLTENKNGYHIFGQNIKYQYPQKVLMEEKYLQKVDPKYPILAYTSSVASVGLIAESFYRTGDNGAFQGLFPKKPITIKPMLYILACLRKQFKTFNYATSMGNIINLEIALPVIESTDPDYKYTIEDIDWDYIEEKISELEQEKISELDTYLKVAGLNDYHLTPDEEKFYNDNKHGCKNDKSNLKEFKIDNLFEQIKTKPIGKKAKDFPTEKSQTYSIPLLTSCVSNNGFARYAKPSDCKTILKNCLTVAYNGDAGTVFYQPHDFAVLQDAYAIKIKNREIKNKEEALYLQTVLHKALHPRYNWNNKAAWKKVKEVTISLPVVLSTDPHHNYTADDIDWDYMERYITIMEKIVIADVVKYKNEKLKVAKKIINS